MATILVVRHKVGYTMFELRRHGIWQGYGCERDQRTMFAGFLFSYMQRRYCFHLIYSVWAEEDWDGQRVWKLKHSLCNTRIRWTT